jgi:hypothetical protein
MRRVEIKEGDRYNRLTIVKEVEPYIDLKSKNKIRMFETKCDCGNVIICRLNNLRTNQVMSCGCTKIDNGVKKRSEVILGEKYNKLTIIKDMGIVNNYRKVECLCECGEKTIVNLNSLRISHTKSCGCQTKYSGLSTRFLEKHGLSKHYLYITCTGMKQRCYNKRCKSYKDYGGRGIKIYGPWINDVESFITWVLENLGERPEGMTLDRKDNDGHYEPGNLRWATALEQVQNRRTPKNKRKKSMDECLT